MRANTHLLLLSFIGWISLTNYLYIHNPEKNYEQYLLWKTSFSKNVGYLLAMLQVYCTGPLQGGTVGSLQCAHVFAFRMP